MLWRKKNQPDPKEAAVPSDEVFHNPVDKKTYVARGGWKTYQPDTPRLEELGREVKLVQVRLLTSDADIAARTSVADVAAFLREAERLAEDSFSESGKKFRVLVQFSCKPNGHEVKLAHRGEATQELLQDYYDALTAANKLPVKDGEVSFQMELSVRP